LSPETVADAYPLKGAFGFTCDTAAPSKLKTALPVPEKDAIVTCTYPNTSKRLTVVQITAVTDVHVDVEQLPELPAPPIFNPAVTVWSLTPKLRPDMVTGANPKTAMFR
jgi:hypothetical protein